MRDVTPSGRYVQRCLLTVLVLSATSLPLAAAQTAQDFSARATATVPAGTTIARVALPAATIAALRTPDGSDLRIFNAAGQLLPYALINAATQPQTRPDAAGQRLLALPIHSGNSDATATGGNAPTLRIIEGPQRRVIEYSATDSSGKAKAAPAATEVRGWLFDSRGVDSELRAVELEATLPAATIVKVSLSASSDLKSWRNLASDVPVFEFPSADASAGAGPVNRRINLPAGTRLKDQYLRLTWSGAGAGALPVTALRAIGAGEVSAVPPVVLDLGPPASASEASAHWTLPSALRAQGLRLSTSANNALMPVRISTRARAGEPWRAVASSVVYRLAGADGVANINPPQPLPYALEREVRVEAQPGYKLSGVPLTLALEYPPLHALFVATGQGPFTIASGKAGLASAALPVATVMPGYKASDEYLLPTLQPQLATAGAANDATDVAGASGGAAESGTGLPGWINRTTILWSVLILAVAVLASLALKLLREQRK